MIDVRLLRDDLPRVKAALGRRGIDLADVEEAARLDEQLRDMAARRDHARARVKALSTQVRDAKSSGDSAKADALASESRDLGAEVKALEDETAVVEAQLRDLMLVIPNLPHDEAPEGAGEEDNPIIRTEGWDPAAYADHQRVPHWDIGTELGILDLERATRMSGSMFTMYRGAGATLVRALCQWFLDSAADAYEEVRPPTLVLTQTLTATGQLPKFGDDAYRIERDDLWAIPTAEVPLTSMHSGEILDHGQLPMRFMAYSPCYRREAGAAGRDTRGLLRSHEFDKVELLAYATADQAPDLLEEILGRAEALAAALGLARRVKEICTGDLGQSHHRSFDLEVYAPGTDQWLEVSSVSWYSDYQARRADVRYRPAEGGGTRHVHTLNGSALAVPRLFAALVETHRQPDGSVRIPEPLLPYFRGQAMITA